MKMALKASITPPVTILILSFLALSRATQSQQQQQDNLQQSEVPKSRMYTDINLFATPITTNLESAVLTLASSFQKAQQPRNLLQAGISDYLTVNVQSGCKHLSFPIQAVV